MGHSTAQKLCTHRGEHNGENRSLGGVRILVVEDNDIDRRVALATATQLGLRAQAVDNGERAIEVLKAEDDNDPFDLLLIDYMMPDLNGLATSKYVKDKLSLKHCPKIVLISGYEKDDIFACPDEQCYVDGFLTKPIASRSLTEVLHDVQDMAEQQGKTWPRRSAEAILAETHVLVAEDNLINQKVARGVLTKKGVTVTVVEHGQAAIDAVVNNPPGTFQLIIMDLDMPVVDGYQAAERIKSHQAHSTIPIIALTAHDSPQDRTRCFAVGMSAYLTKPVKPNFLYDTLLRLLK